MQQNDSGLAEIELDKKMQFAETKATKTSCHDWFLKTIAVSSYQSISRTK